MPHYFIDRYEVRADAISDAEAAMRTFADHVRKELPGSSWTMYRDPDAPTTFVAFLRVDDARAEERHRKSSGAQTFTAALAPLLVAGPTRTSCELVTSSDLGRRVRR